MRSAAVIAAAGLSSRMHGFKPMLCLGEKTMIETIIDNFLNVGVEEIVVVAGYKANMLREHLKKKPVTVCENADFAETKMFDSMRIGLQAIKMPYDVVFLTPGDVPLVKEETLRRMLDSGAEVCRPTCGGKNGHPAMFTRSYADKLLSYSGENGLIGAMRSFGDSVVNIQVDDVGATMDADTPEDFKLLRRLDMMNRGGKLWADVQVRIAKTDAILTPLNAQLLEMIGHTGSIQSACASMHMSYTKGWIILNKMEQDLGDRLVERVVGGSNGGGTVLTKRAEHLLKTYLAYQEKVRIFAEKQFAEMFADDLHSET